MIWNVRAFKVSITPANDTHPSTVDYTRLGFVLTVSVCSCCFSWSAWNNGVRGTSSFVNIPNFALKYWRYLKRAFARYRNAIFREVRNMKASLYPAFSHILRFFDTLID